MINAISPGPLPPTPIPCVSPTTPSVAPTGVVPTPTSSLVIVKTPTAAPDPTIPSLECKSASCNWRTRISGNTFNRNDYTFGESCAVRLNTNPMPFLYNLKHFMFFCSCSCSSVAMQRVSTGSENGYVPRPYMWSVSFYAGDCQNSHLSKLPPLYLPCRSAFGGVWRSHGERHTLHLQLQKEGTLCSSPLTVGEFSAFMLLTINLTYITAYN